MQFIGSGPVVALWANALLLIVLFASFRVGSFALALLRLPEAIFTKNEHHLFSVAIGIILVSLAVLSIGSAGALTISAVCMLLMFFILSPYLLKKSSPVWALLPSTLAPPKMAVQIFWALVSFVFFLSWIQAQMPVIGMDALAYHLFHPKVFVLQHKIFPMPLEFNRESLWPYLTEMLFTLGLLLQGTLLAQLFHWVFYLLTAAAIFLFSKRFFDESVAYLAVLIFIFTPAAFAQSGHCYIDLTLGFYSFLALYLFLIASDAKCVRSWFLAGLFAGGAAATKLLGLGCAAIFFVGALFVARSKPKACFLFLCGCFAAAGIWYIRSWVLLGNPVYPFFSHFFNGNGYEFDISEGVSMGKDLKAFLLLPWNMTMYPRSFGGEMIGALFLLFLPPFIARSIRKPSKPMVVLAITTLSYGAFLFTQSQHVRFFLSIVPAMSVGAAVAWAGCLKGSRLLKHAILVATTVVLVMHAGIFIYRTRDCWSVAVGKTSAREYLLSHERSFKGNEYLRSHMKDEERILYSAEVRYFYNDNKSVIWDCYPLRVILARQNKTLTQFLNEKQPDYIWLGNDSIEELWSFVRDQGYKLVYEYQFTEKPTTFNNYIYKLENKLVSDPS